MAFLTVIVGVSLAALLIAPQFAEALLVVAYIGFPLRQVIRSERGNFPWVAILIGALCLGLHCFGWKVFGRSVKAELEHLKSPRNAVALERPSSVRCEDGSRVLLEGIWFPYSIELEPARKLSYFSENLASYEAFQSSAPLARAWWLRRALWLNYQTAEPLRVEITHSSTNLTQTASVQYLRTIRYFCGNTWFPTFFPARLPTREREDLRIGLLRAGVALPTMEIFESNPRLAENLLRAASGAIWIRAPRQDPEVIAVARKIIETKPDYLEVGERLLRETGDTNSYPWLVERIREDARRRGSEESLDSLRSIDYESARKSFRNVLSRREREGAEFEHSDMYLLEAAMALAQWNDFSALDFLVREFSQIDKTNPRWKEVGMSLCNQFRFLSMEVFHEGVSEKSAEYFAAWYEAVRPRLRHAEAGDMEGFAVGDNKPFDAVYFETMRPFLKEYVAQRDAEWAKAR